MKGDNKNKLKQFVKKHELAFAIAGGAVILVAGVAIGYHGFRPKSIASIHSKSTGMEDIQGLLDLCACVDKGTRATIIWEPHADKIVTVADWFGKSVDKITACGAQPDDVISSIIYNIAKKAET